MRTYAEAHAWPAHGGPLVERDNMRIRLNYETTENGNVYGDDVQRITGIYCPITGNDSLIFTRTTQYKIVPKRQGAGGVAVDVGFSGGSAAPRRSVNNCTREPVTGTDGVEHADYEVGVTVNFDALSRQEKRELAQRLSDDVRCKRKKRPPEREEGTGLSVKEKQISELLALCGIDAGAAMVRSVMAGASVACGDLVMTVQDGRLVSRNRAGAGLTVTLTDEGLITSRRASNELPSQIMATKQQAKNLINRMKVAFRHVKCDS